MAGKGAFFLGTTVDPSGKAKPENLTLDSSDLTTHGVIVGHDRLGQDGSRHRLARGGAAAGIPALVLDPKGDMGNLALTFPDLSPPSFQPWVNESDARRRGMTVDELRREDRDAVAGGPRSAGNRPRPDQGASRRRRLHDLHARLDGGHPAQRRRLAARAEALLGHRSRDAARRDRGPRHEPARLAGIEAAPLSSREHVLLSNLIENAWRAGPRPRPRHADRRDPVAASAQARRLRDRRVLPAQGPDRARPQAQRARRLAAVRGLGRRRAARPAVAALHAGGQAARGDRLPRASLRRGAAVRRHARPLEARHLDARAAGNVGPARARVHGRGVRLRARRPRRRRRRSRS